MKHAARILLLMGGCLLVPLPGCQESGKRADPWSAAAESTSPAAPPQSGDPPFRVNPGDKPDLPDPPGMVWIPGGTFLMGSTGPEARPDEGPLHAVTVRGFYMDTTEVTNARFAEFVDATGYVTVAEKKPDLNEILAQLPPGTPPLPEEKLVPGALVFRPTEQPVKIGFPGDHLQWWEWVPGANWRHPAGPDSNLDGLADHPVVQICWDDAVAYCEWAGKQLPTEAQWEHAARAGHHQWPYIWGTDPVSDTSPQANIWQGQFPYRNAVSDGYPATAPVRSYPPNDFGLYDMAGNVWEWCYDWYGDRYYESLVDEVQLDPTGPHTTSHPREPRKSQRGGSFLCNRDYCSSYRPSARMGTSTDTGMGHTGFRAVLSEAAWREELAAAGNQIP